MAGDYYNLQDHHKQIILRNVQHFDMLGLEARRHLRHLLRTATFHIQDDHLPLTLQVKPRVVKQQKSGTSTTKLLVKYRWLYTPVQQRVITLTDLKPIKLCTHVGFQHDIADALLDVTSITSLGQWVGDNRVFIVVWQDIRPQDPALDSTGPTQTSDDGSHMPIYYLFEKSKHVFTPPEEEHVLTPPVEAFKPPKKRFEWIKAHLKKIRL
ncbi:hypothetical protein BN1723_007147 [Verticillium longisporum]|uniref:Uncharacterized protein n=1 Tax=Verticillium longisporum TaxID=100787 RepID=A0A0G4NJE8_VERLO|nr:hypothetical protein BN1723_007147 [Verticillium longisporum]